MSAAELDDEAQEAVTDRPEGPSVEAAPVEEARADEATTDAEPTDAETIDASADEGPVFDSELIDREEVAIAATGGDSGADAEPNADSHAEADADYDAELDADLDAELDPLDQPSEASLWGDGGDVEGLERGADSAERPGLEKAPPLAGGLDRLKSVLESLVFVSNKPISDRMLAKVANAQPREVRPLLLRLQREYEGRGIELHLVAGGWQFRSATANAPFVRGLVAPKPVRLSRAQIESLAIVAYRQPITRPEIDEIRGVDSGPALKVLAERNLVKVLGRKDEPGRPLLYGTTDHFLEFFGLSSLKDLPTLKEFSELTEESRELFERRMGEPLDLRAVEAQARAAEAAAQEAMLAEHDPQQDLGLEDDAARPAANDVTEEVHSAPEFGEDEAGRAGDEPAPESVEAAEEDGIPDQAIDTESDEPVSQEPNEMNNERFEQEDEAMASSGSDELDHVSEAISDDFEDEDFESPRKTSVDEDEEPADEDDDDLDDDEEDDDLDDDEDDDLDDDEDEDEDDEYGDDFGDEDDEYADEDEDEDEDDEDTDDDE